MELQYEFGPEIASLVKELTNNTEERSKLKKYEYLKIKMSNMSSNALLIKLADLFQNLRLIERDFDNKEKESIDFIFWLYKKTKYIIEDFEEIVATKIDDRHKAILTYVRAVFFFFKIQHDL
jgi:hypothetical protein